jgi:hypothetical protein
VYWHAPSAQPVAVVFAGAVAAQLVAQFPQCRMSVLRFDSHPFDPTFCRSPLQSPYPASQVCWHTAVLHAGAEFTGRSSQFVPQFPQLATSPLVKVSQPLRLTFSLALQSLYPAVQLAMLQDPAAHAGVPFTLLHARPQPLQCAVLVFTFVSQPAATVQSP